MKNIATKFKIEYYYLKYVINSKRKYRNKFKLVQNRFPMPRTEEEIIAFNRFYQKYYPSVTLIHEKLDCLVTGILNTQNEKIEKDPHYLTIEQEKILKRILNNEEYVYATDDCFNDIEQWLRLQYRLHDAEKVRQMSDKIYSLNGEEPGSIKKT